MSSSAKGELVLFVKLHCFHCQLARDILQRHGYDVQEIDVSTHSVRLDELHRATNHLGTPALFEGSHYVGVRDLFFSSPPLHFVLSSHSVRRE